MLFAKKSNKVYKINEAQKDAYLKQGFDIYEDDKLIEHSPLKTIKFNEHVKITEELKAENEALKTENEALKTENESLKTEIETLKAESATKKGK